MREHIENQDLQRALILVLHDVFEGARRQSGVRC